MQIRNLGRTGLKVSSLCLGAMTFGNNEWGCDEATSVSLVNAFLDGGGNFIDTADAYSAGVSEEILGRALGARRGEAVIATKVFAAMGPGPNDSGLSRKHIMDAVDASLRRLGTDYIDLYQIHGFDPTVPQDETLQAMSDCVKDGKVRYIGASNHYGWHLLKANAMAKELGTARYDSLQPQYSLVARGIDREILPMCIDQGIGVVPYSPLGGGILTGKLKPGVDPPEGSRAAAPGFAAFYRDEYKLEVGQTVAAIAGEMGCSPSRLALAWCMNQEGITSPIFGARTMEQLEDNMGAADLDIPEDVADQLEKLTRLPLEYPADILRNLAQARTRS